VAWERLKTDYKDAVWSGLRKFIPIDNGDGSYSVKDVTQYTVYDESFFGALDANRINAAVNAIMAALENGTDLYEVFTEFFENQKEEFNKQANLDLDTFNVFLDNLQATANADVVQLKKDYTAEMTAFENNQETLFNQWFAMIKDQLSADAAGKLQNEINDVETHIRNLAVKIHFNDTVGTAAAITVQNVTSGSPSSCVTFVSVVVTPFTIALTDLIAIHFPLPFFRYFSDTLRAITLPDKLCEKFTTWR
jgi:hypothetical protein